MLRISKLQETDGGKGALSISRRPHCIPDYKSNWRELEVDVSHWQDENRCRARVGKQLLDCGRPQVQLSWPLQHTIISREMTAECDRQVAQFAGLHSLPFWNRCLLCGTNLELDWPDLSELNASDIKNHAHEKWRRAAESGCPFCSIVIAVIDDAVKQHGCSVPDHYRRLWTDGPFGGDLEAFQVFLGRNESTGHFLLALELVMMPFFHESGKQSEFWGTITVYLDGPQPPFLPQSPFCIASH